MPNTQEKPYFKPYKFGRPTKYTPELVAEVEDYLETWDANGDVVPTQGGLCLRIGINRETVDAWRKEEDKQYFSDMLKRIRELQRSILIQRGLDGSFASKALSIMLSQHGLHEKTENKNTNKTTITIENMLQEIEDESIDKPRLPLGGNLAIGHESTDG